MKSERDPSQALQVSRLRKDAVGLWGVLFMTMATAAPITAMVGNVPIAVGFGNGANAPAGYMVATVLLTLFSVGYVEMAKHITSTGAFYGFISHGLGRVVGLASGVAVTWTYMIFEAALVGIFAFFCADLLGSLLGLRVDWIFLAALMLLVNGILCHFDIELTSRVLGIALVLEIAMLLLMAVAVLFHGGGTQGMSWESINPVNAFKAAEGIPKATAGIGLFFAFWSWVGFESSAMYGEESRNPKKIIPQATMISVIGIGALYTFVSWMAIAGTGAAESVRLAQNPATGSEIFFTPTRVLLGDWAVIVFKILLISGSFACGMAFHNCAARYSFALGREKLFAVFGSTVGRSHEIHGSPYIASFVQTLFASTLVLVFWLMGKDPYADLYAVLAILGTMAIMIVQTLCAFSVIAYFHFGGNESKRHAHWFKTFVAPLIGGVGMIYVTHLLWINKEFAAGDSATSLLFRLIPWLVAASFLTGACIALYFKYFDKDKYDIIGRIVLK
ncbi:APC family permease [Verminephrobacter eiseniae]|uniref:APC family permease n=1 Tax=Verminephrobacter eiseniae TaxID=364317 RepID=UPI002237B14A|nr:APC family permease [Verminephrobacter eiseniae]MCW5261659.1 APC family permease [Verminephrobacter eiseniae]